MSFISLRQLLDHAAENNYGVPAFNVNNLEQILAIMEAAEGDPEPGDPAGLGRRAQVRGRTLSAPHGVGGGRIFTRHSRGAAPGSRGDPRRVHAVAAFGIHQRHDGRLAEGGREDAVQL